MERVEGSPMPLLSKLEIAALAKGRAEGKAEGFALGMLLGEVCGILRVKFQRPADSLLERIKTITEETKMAELLKVASEAVSIGEVECALAELGMQPIEK
jgi:hypothetical protein